MMVDNENQEHTFQHLLFAHTRCDSCTNFRAMRKSFSIKNSTIASCMKIYGYTIIHTQLYLSFCSLSSSSKAGRILSTTPCNTGTKLAPRGTRYCSYTQRQEGRTTRDAYSSTGNNPLVYVRRLAVNSSWLMRLNMAE